ncbi:MAG: hypothetical protein WCE64_12800 [Bacteroidales bacterium]
MKNYFLKDYPTPDKLLKSLKNNFPEFRETNGHVHTPYSFSAFTDMGLMFSMARKENISVLGINDFYVADGYEAFYSGSVRNNVFPLFNIEFIGLLKEEQKKGVRINDPNNPGRIYFSGKGLDYPFNPGWRNRLKLNSVVKETQLQMKEMIARLNELISSINPSISLSYDDIRSRFTNGLVRERHLARAIREAAAVNYPDRENQQHFIESLYGGRKSDICITNSALLENEIRSNLLKNGGAAYVEEKENTFPDLEKLIKIILNAGGIPCYPVLLDNVSGNFTEFESSPEKLHRSLSALKVGCIELIPGRNDARILRKFVSFFHEKNYLITFGTEHNTPEIIPLTVSARDSEKLDDQLKIIAWESTCVIAAHQYLRAQGRQGYVLPDGTSSTDQKKELTLLGKLVIEYFLQNNKAYEARN